MRTALLALALLAGPEDCMHSYTDIESFPDSITLIDNTDPPNAVNFNTGPEGLANRTRWLKNTAVRAVIALHDDPAWAPLGSGWSHGSYQPVVDGMYLANLPFSPKNGDILEFELAGTARYGNTDPTDAEIRLYQVGINGAATYTAIPAAMVRFLAPGTNLNFTPFVIRGRVVVTVDAAVPCQVYIAGMVTSGTGIFLAGGYTLTVARYRRSF